MSAAPLAFAPELIEVVAERVAAIQATPEPRPQRRKNVLRTYEGCTVPTATEDAIVATRGPFVVADAMTTVDLAAALGIGTATLTSLLEAAGIVPLPITVNGRCAKGYRRCWFQGYYEQLDAAHAPTKGRNAVPEERPKGGRSAQAKERAATDTADSTRKKPDQHPGALCQ
jgi:hypothetical protein